MAQEIIMEWIPKKDAEKLTRLVYDALDYGFIHEDLMNEIFDAMALWVVKQPEFQEVCKKDFEEYSETEINENNIEEFLEFCTEDGNLFWVDYLDELSEEFAKYTVFMFRGIIFESMFGCNGSYVSDFDKYIEEIEENIKEDFEYFKSNNFFK